MKTYKMVVLFDEDYTLLDRIIWNLYHHGAWRLTEFKWIDGYSNKGYVATITGNDLVVKFLDWQTRRKYSKYL